MLEDLKEIIAIPSVNEKSEHGAPYGKPCKAALEWFLKKGEQYGMKTVNVDDRCGYIEIGSGKEYIAVLCHLDVVPVGDGWSTDPFTLTVDGGKLYGRGVADDKGPLVASMHALKRVFDEKVPLKHRVRLIVGCDEERGSSCLAYYVKHEELPAASFVPDSAFPLTFSEKGIAQFELAICDEKFAESVSAISGADCRNAVPNSASVTIKKDSPAYNKLKQLDGSLSASVFSSSALATAIITDGHAIDDYSIIQGGDGIVIEAKGTAAHASTPNEGDNALWKIFTVLSVIMPDSRAVNEIYGKVCTPLCYDKLSLALADEKSGELTFALTMARATDNGVCVVIDSRLPLCAPRDTVIERFETALNAKATVLHSCGNLYVPLDSPLCTSLMKVYNRHFDDNEKPMISGGGTYAHELQNAVAFGACPKGLDVNMHGADENYPVELFYKLVDIYYDAIVTLANLDKLR